jgi:hypothetical protein
VGVSELAVVVGAILAVWLVLGGFFALVAWLVERWWP